MKNMLGLSPVIVCVGGTRGDIYGTRGDLLGNNYFSLCEVLNFSRIK